MKHFRTIIVVVTVVLFTACSSSLEPAKDKSSEVKEYNTVRTLKKDAVDNVHGKETRFSYGAILGFGEIKANGVAYVRTYADGVSLVTANLNIAKAAEKKQYSAWLGNEAAPRSISIGVLQSIVGDTRHSTKLETSSDISTYDSIFVYVGGTSDDPQSGTLIAKGTLKTQ